MLVGLIRQPCALSLGGNTWEAARSKMVMTAKHGRRGGSRGGSTPSEGNDSLIIAKDAGGSLRERAFDAARGGDSEVAARMLSEYLQLPGSGSDFAAMNCMGAMSAQLGMFDQAVASFQKALATSSNEDSRANTLFNLGNACTALSRHGDALAAFEQAFLLRPSDTEAQVQIGNCHVALGIVSS